MKFRLVAYIALAVWLGLTASSFVVSAELLPYANPVASTGLRFLLACVLMLPFALGRLTLLTVELGFKYLLISLFLVLFFLGLFKSLQTTTALRTSVIYTLLPLLTVLVSYCALRMRPSAMQVVGFLMGSSGAVWSLLASNGGDSALWIWYSGDSIFLLSCLSLALHVVLIKKWLGDIDPVQNVFMILLVGGALLCPFVLGYGELKNVGWRSTSFWSVFLYLTCFTTIGTFLLQQYLLKYFSPSHLLAVSYLIPFCVLLPDAMSHMDRLYYALPGFILTAIAIPIIFGVDWKLSFKS